MIALGCVGDDEIGDIILSNLQKENCECFLDKKINTTSSQCGVAIVNEERFLIPIIEASRLYTEDFLEKCLKENIFENKNIEIFFFEAYFALTTYKGLESFLNYFSQLNKKICSTLTLVTLCCLTSEEIYLKVKKILSFTNYIFCNISELRDYISTVITYEKEFLQLEDTQQALQNLGDIRLKCLKEFDFSFAKALSEILFKILPSEKERFILITWNKNPIVYAKFDNKINAFEYADYIPLREISKEDIVDTNGAGDGKLYLYYLYIDLSVIIYCII